MDTSFLKPVAFLAASSLLPSMSVTTKEVRVTEDDKDPTQLTPEQLSEVHGGRPGGKPTTVTGKLLGDDIISLTDGVNNDTLFAGPGDDDKSFNLGMPGHKK
jgi:hypothetical protein